MALKIDLVRALRLIPPLIPRCADPTRKARRLAAQLGRAPCAEGVYDRVGRRAMVKVASSFRVRSGGMVEGYYREHIHQSRIPADIYGTA